MKTLTKKMLTNLYVQVIIKLQEGVRTSFKLSHKKYVCTNFNNGRKCHGKIY